jgi:Zn-dependent M28 family amino/carboxypeptidase
VLVALWDAEEDGLIGSAAYLQAPRAPAAETIAYLNFDIQGSNLLPSSADRTVMVGAETGGAALVDAATTATAASTLQTASLSLVFGQGRSDHANFVAAGVPSVFFTDATGPCYHTPYDDVDVVDFAKLDQQIVTATALATDLVATNTPPVFDPAAPLATYEDAQTMLEVTTAARPHFSRFGPAGQAASEQYVADLEAIVDAGPEAFDDAAIGTLLAGAAAFVDALTKGECDGFLP